MTSFDRLGDRIRATDAPLAVALNPDPARLPSDCREYDYPRRAFTRRIVDATHEAVAAYLVSPAFYEDSDGWTALAETVAYAQGKGVPVIVDGKWADVSSPPRRDLLDEVDAVTVSPFCGKAALAPVLDRDCGVFVTCRTPNAGASDLQDRTLSEDDETLAECVATTVAEEWSSADVGLLVGGPTETVETLRERASGLPFLVVGGADTDPEVAEHALTSEWRPASDARPVGLVAVSRAVVYAGETAGRGRQRGRDDYATAARRSARRLARQLGRHCR